MLGPPVAAIRHEVVWLVSLGTTPATLIQQDGGCRPNGPSLGPTAPHILAFWDLILAFWDLKESFLGEAGGLG